MTDQIEKLDADLEEAKATGENSESADAVTPAGGSNTKRKADKGGAPEAPIKQGSSDVKTPQGSNDTGMKEGIEVLFDGEDLSEDFKAKTTAIFEAALHERVEAEKAQLAEQFAADLEEQTAIIADELVEKVDSYLDYVINEWVKENEVQIESNLKVEVAESLLGNLVSLVKEHNLEMGEETVDAVQMAEAKADEISEKYNNVVAELIEAKKIIEAKERETAFEEVAEGLADTQIEKLRVLSEGVTYNNSQDYMKKLSVIKESYFKEVPAAAGDDLSDQLLEEDVDAEAESKVVSLDPQMATYAAALSRISTK